MARPSSAEPLHGVDANAKLVATMGKRPEEEDAAIAQEWSPRGGRKLNNAQGPPRACAIERQDQRECGVDSGWESSSLPSSPEAPWSCSLLPLCQQQRNRARPLEVRGRRRGNRNSFSNSPGGERRARDPWKPIHDSSGHNVPLPSTPNLLARGQSGRHDDVQNYGIATAAPFDDDIFSNSSNGQGDDSDELRVGFSADFNALGQGFSPAPRRNRVSFAEAPHLETLAATLRCLDHRIARTGQSMPDFCGLALPSEQRRRKGRLR